jgi:hypothetical protein
MSESQSTTIENKVTILSELWLNYRADEDFADYIEYNDLGLPLAYLVDNGVVKMENEMSTNLINETWDLLLAGLGIEDTGFETLDNMLDKA